MTTRGKERMASRPQPRRLADAELAARAAYVLRGNDLGTMTTAAPRLYPHMWSWDAAFVAIGLAAVSVERAVLELDTLLAAQWSTGMLPHIVFAPAGAGSGPNGSRGGSAGARGEHWDARAASAATWDAHAPGDGGGDGYFPGPGRWGCLESGAPAPESPRTSGICQPPVHAIAVARIVAAGRRGGRTDRRVAEEFLARAWMPLMAWHRWLATARDPRAEGLVTLYHGWESGMDNSPRWDAPYSRVVVGEGLPPYRRRDTTVVGDASQRPSNLEYDRYLWLMEQMRRVGYADTQLAEACDFVVQDVFFSAILAVASDVLARLGEQLRSPAADVADLRSWAARFRAGVAAAVDPATTVDPAAADPTGANPAVADPAGGLARDRDLRAGAWLATPTIAGFAPLLCGGLPPDAEQRLLALLDSPAWAGHPGLCTAVPPSTSPASPSFRPREYWRGPQWPVLAWLLAWAFDHRGWPDRAAALRAEGLRLAGDGTFAEYYEPFTGEPLGSTHQSWTAATILDWLC